MGAGVATHTRNLKQERDWLDQPSQWSKKLLANASSCWLAWHTADVAVIRALSYLLPDFHVVLQRNGSEQSNEREGAPIVSITTAICIVDEREREFIPPALLKLPIYGIPS